MGSQGKCLAGPSLWGFSWLFIYSLNRIDASHYSGRRLEGGTYRCGTVVHSNVPSWLLFFLILIGGGAEISMKDSSMCLRFVFKGKVTPTRSKASFCLVKCSRQMFGLLSCLERVQTWALNFLCKPHLEKAVESRVSS